MTSSALLQGLTLSSSGTLSGTPTEVGMSSGFTDGQSLHGLRIRMSRPF